MLDVALDQSLPGGASTDAFEAARPPAGPAPRMEVVFVDTRVPDVQSIVAGVSPSAEVVLIDSARDGIGQIVEALAGRTGVDAIHIVSHGDDGVLLLGSGPLHAGNMGDYADELAQIGQALGEDGDIHLWGCDVGAGEKGLAFVEALARATGADVAASGDATGRNGDWELEIRTGAVAESAALDAGALGAYDHTLATFSVATVAELKSALTVAASNGQADTITLTADIAASGAGDFTNGYLAHINLNEAHALTIVGGGHALDANFRGRVVYVSAGDNVTFQNLTIRDGLSAGNGGQVWGPGHDAYGAGIANLGTLTLDSVTVTSNVASGGGGAGAALGGGGGGGGGFGGTGGGHGGSGNGWEILQGRPGANGFGGAGGDGSIGNSGGGGGSSGGNGGTGVYNGGSGGTATNTVISIGGGGGGSGDDGDFNHGGGGGSAVGGIYNGMGATILVIGTSVISNNLGAGGGGGAGATYGYVGQGGTGGKGVGAVWNLGTFRITADNYGALTGNAGASGTGGAWGVRPPRRNP